MNPDSELARTGGSTVSIGCNRCFGPLPWSLNSMVKGTSGEFLSRVQVGLEHMSSDVLVPYFLSAHRSLSTTGYRLLGALSPPNERSHPDHENDKHQ